MQSFLLFKFNIFENFNKIVFVFKSLHIVYYFQKILLYDNKIETVILFIFLDLMQTNSTFQHLFVLLLKVSPFEQRSKIPLNGCSIIHSIFFY